MQPRNFVNYLNPINWNHPLNRGLVSWWLPLPKRSGGLYLRDLTRKNDGTLTNGPTWVPGTNGFGALSFNGTNNYVDCGSNPSLDLSGAGTSSTIAVWLRYTLAGIDFGIDFSSKAVWAMRSWRLYYYYDSPQLTFDMYDTSFGNRIFATTSTTTASDGNWHLIVGTRDCNADTMRIYVDGVNVTTSSTGADSSTSYNYPSSMYIGKPFGGGFSYFNGNFGAHWAYNRALSANEVAALYDQCLRGHPDTLNWLPKTSFPSISAAPPGPALSFNAAWAIQSSLFIGAGSFR